MAGVTDTGFESKSTEEIITDVVTRANSEEYFGVTFPTTPDSPFYVHAGVLSGGISDLWQLGQALAVQQNRDTATGVWLDSLAGLIYLTRLQESGSVGNLVLTGKVGKTVTAFFPVADTNGNNVLTQESVTFNRSACYESTFTVNTVANSTDYTLNVNGTVYNYVSDASATEEEILSGLQALVNAAPLASATVVEDTLVVTYATYANSLSTTNSSNLTLASVGAIVEGVSAETGAISYPSNTITTIVGSNIDLYSVTNPSAFSVGRLKETDAELRVRMAEKSQSTGTATKPSIEAKISELEGVTSVLVIENQTAEEVDGIPPKSFETFITGGSVIDIAEALWTSKPAAIYPHGDITQVITDENGDPQVVRFSRPTEVFAWVRVTYSLNPEETFPANGTEAMKTAVVNHGSDMYSGEDFVNSKFYGPLYTIKGMFITQIEIATTTSEMDTPTYVTTPIDVEKTEYLTFDTTRVVFA
jgi:uncharacterized phage protein gp47/JayE